MTYRDLNQRANVLARYLVASGLKRGGHVVVVLPCGVDLATTLLAVLKAGGCYTWIDPCACCSGYPRGASIALKHGDAEDQYVNVDVSRVLESLPRVGSNLPVLTRGTDIACLLEDASGRAVRVPHDTIVSLRPQSDALSWPWVGEPGALDLWTALLAGGTAAVAASVRSAAA